MHIAFRAYIRAQDASITLRLPEFIIAPEMPALSIGSILTMPPKAAASRGRGVNHGCGTHRIRLSDVGLPHRDPAVPPPPPEEVADHDELHEGEDEHGDSASHGIVSGAYVAPAPLHPLAPIATSPVPPIVTPYVPPITPPVPLVVTPLIPPTVPVVPFQLNPDLGAFVTQVVTIAVTAKTSDPWEVFKDLYYFVSDILPSEEDKYDRFRQGLHVEIRASMTWFRGNNFCELVEAALNVEKVKQEEKEYEQKLSKKHGQGSSQGFRERATKRRGSSF
ncbi:hypothetical protein GH714_029495 [Hevea brasiliensis]|uniref:Uncharacterized protein n=1 Tax=Hevea brasiliensis TaxID=3981 RepID=A0A6A6M1F1_HEVBR|nr:hypothetical protein GH714_029495 [Hevea brasiliensis]